MFYKELRENLSLLSFPAPYEFEFAIPRDQEKLDKMEEFFEGEAQVEIEKIAGSELIKATLKAVVLSANEVIITYKELTKIEGVEVLKETTV